MRRTPFKRKYNKFRAQKTRIDGILFDSKLEATRYQELKLLEAAGEISEFEIQVPYSLIVHDRQVCVIIPDFRYKEGAKEVIEDAKGVITDLFRIKWKLMQILYPDYEYRIYKR